MRKRERSLLRNVAYFGVGLLLTAAERVIRGSRERSHWAKGKVVVITGGSRGLGLALAEEFGRRGARLVLAARNEMQLSNARKQLVDSGAVRSGDDVLIVPADLRRPEDAMRLINEATRRFGRVDLLINNAGVITVGPVENHGLEQFHDVMDSNFYTGLHCTLAVLPQMLRRHEGSIANVASIGGRIAVPHLLPYSASKFATVGFSEGLGMELRSKGIRVTTVCPGLMRTGSHHNAVFIGDTSREYRWFAMASNMPGASVSARSAARKIADGIADGAAEVTVSPQALLAARFGNLSPELKRMVMAGMHRALPNPVEGRPDARRGEELRGHEFLPMRMIGRSAARRYNQAGAFAAVR